MDSSSITGELAGNANPWDPMSGLLHPNVWEPSPGICRWKCEKPSNPQSRSASATAWQCGDSDWLLSFSFHLVGERNIGLSSSCSAVRGNCHHSSVKGHYFVLLYYFFPSHPHAYCPVSTISHLTSFARLFSYSFMPLYLHPFHCFSMMQRISPTHPLKVALMS